jgi:peptidoglycan hydrolase-like protein with peptidoglycan-binding domain
MAYRESVQNKELRDSLFGAQFFWNIHENVGYGYKNNKSDVLLVQFLLNTWNRYNGLNTRLLVPDGQFGGNTWREIKTFQKEVGESFQTSDGCVTAVNGTKLLSPKAKTPYTILVLNMAYINIFRLYYPDIRKDPKIPEPLIPQLTGMPAVV